MLLNVDNDRQPAVSRSDSSQNDTAIVDHFFYVEMWDFNSCELNGVTGRCHVSSEEVSLLTSQPINHFFGLSP